MKYNVNMPQKHSKDWLLEFAGLFTVGAVAVISFVTIENNSTRWIALGLTLAFGALFLFHHSIRVHFYFALQTTLAVSLILLQPNTFAAGVLFFVLSAEAMTVLPLRQATLWISIFTVATYFNFAFVAGWLSALIYVLPYAGGFVFFGTFGKAMRDAEAARQESQRLLEELQTAHRQLQDYASQVEQLTIAEERNRLAREMHDAVGHRLTVTAVQLEGAQRLIPTDPDRAARMIGTMRDEVKLALAELRRTVATLRAPLEVDLPLTQSLARLATAFQEATGLNVHLTLPEDLSSVPEAGRLALYRAAQESLTNAQRHAGAKNIWLSLQTSDDNISLTVADDGIGFPASMNGVGFGLRGLRERATQLGGELHLESRPGGGAQLCFRLPLLVRR
ncbi:MAG: sensor histidine kinase [Chloroflexi bacterium]|nr:sensor histidine kinase [Chloroflexota bacterium]